MDSENTNNLNNENVNPNLNSINEDLTNIFDTPVDLNVTNLGVGETTNEYNKEDTEILDLNVSNEFKEAEIKVEPLNINFESNPFELNNEASENVEKVEEPVALNPINDNIGLGYEPSSVDNLNPINLDNLNQEPVISEVQNFQPQLIQTEDSNNISEPLVIENSNVEQVQESFNDVQSHFQENFNDVQSHFQENVMMQQDMNQEPVVSEQLNIGTQVISDDLKTVNKKKKNILPIIIVLLLITILGGLVAFYFLVVATPKNIFNKAFTSGIEYLSNSFDNIGKYDTIAGKGSVSYEIKLEDTSAQSVFDMLNGIDLDYEYGVDYKNKLMNFKINSTYNNEKLLDLDMYTENSKLYMLFVDVYNTYIASPIEEYDNFFNTDINQEELKIILNSFGNALSKSLTDEDFVKTEETIKINGEDIKVDKNSFVLNNKNVNRIVKSILTILKDDTDFISAVNKISADNSVDTKAALEDAINNISENNSSDIVIATSIYTKGVLKEVVGFSFEVKDDETIKIFVNKTADNTYAYVITKGSEELITGSMKANVTSTEMTNNSNIELVLSMKDLGSLKLNLQNNVNYNAAFNKPDISNNIGVEQLPENWISNIAILAMNNPGFAKLMTTIQTIGAQEEVESQQQIGDFQNIDTNYTY